MAKDNQTLLSRIFHRYLIDAMGAMALGLFSSLIIGLIIGQLAKIPGLSFLAPLTTVLGAASPVVGSAIGVAIAFGLKTHGLVAFSCAGAGAIGYMAGGPVGAFIAAIVGAELGQLVSKKTPVDIVITPLVVLIAGGLAGNFVGPSVSAAMTWLGNVINTAAYFSRVPMGLAVGAVVGMVLTSPISSAALCISLALGGLAAGAATAGCAAQMIGFAVISFRDNGVSGLISQGLGTAKLQLPNVMRRPQIWIAPTVASAVCGALSTVFGMENIAAGAGMGTSGLVGQITMFGVMAPQWGSVKIIALMVLVHVITPALVALAVDMLLRRIGWVKSGDMKLRDL